VEELIELLERIESSEGRQVPAELLHTEVERLRAGDDPEAVLYWMMNRKRGLDRRAPRLAQSTEGPEGEED
jgi:hypothetical protein